MNFIKKSNHYRKYWFSVLKVYFFIITKKNIDRDGGFWRYIAATMQGLCSKDLASPGKPPMKLHKMTNDECRLTNGGIASGFAFGYDPTRRSVVFK